MLAPCSVWLILWLVGLHRASRYRMDCQHFIEQFQDYLAPKLDTYEQALYLYIFRHSRLLGAD